MASHEDQDDAEAIMAGTTCPECHRGKVPGAPTCAKCKNARAKNAGREARAQVNEAKYKAFIQAESLAIVKRSLQDLGEQINRSNAIAAKKQKCMEAVPAIMQALPAVLATGGHISNPFAVSKAQKHQARERQAQQEAASSEAFAAQHQARERQQQAAAQQQQAAAAAQLHEQQQQAAQFQQQADQMAAQLREQAAALERDKAKVAQQRAELDRQRTELARQAAPGMHVRTIADVSEEDRRTRANAAANAAANREVDRSVADVVMTPRA